MTKAQEFKLYWPSFWRGFHGCWQKGAAGFELAWRHNWSGQVDDIARGLAEKSQCVRDANLIRHAAHRMALGRDKSHRQFTNRDLDRVWALFTLLAEPENLRALQLWENPEIGARVRIDHTIRTAVPEGYARHVAADKFGTKNADALNNAQARQLAMTLRCRAETLMELPF